MRWRLLHAGPLIINYNIFDGPGSVDPAIEKIVMHDEAIAINQCARHHATHATTPLPPWLHCRHCTDPRLIQWAAAVVVTGTVV